MWGLCCSVFRRRSRAYAALGAWVANRGVVPWYRLLRGLAQAQKKGCSCLDSGQPNLLILQGSVPQLRERDDQSAHPVPQTRSTQLLTLDVEVPVHHWGHSDHDGPQIGEGPRKLTTADPHSHRPLIRQCSHSRATLRAQQEKREHTPDSNRCRRTSEEQKPRNRCEIGESGMSPLPQHSDTAASHLPGYGHTSAEQSDPH
mmetsp:Transcript_36078/g.86862  ORF Transcript_36078/g.86862 Transcript_36078/m.86862 type:complete len:201 (-) Transcript_36078:691-1293(-)